MADLAESSHCTPGQTLDFPPIWAVQPLEPWELEERGLIWPAIIGRLKLLLVLVLVLELVLKLALVLLLKLVLELELVLELVLKLVLKLVLELVLKLVLELVLKLVLELKRRGATFVAVHGCGF